MDDGHASKYIRFKMACQLCCPRHDDAMQWHLIVGPFQAVDEGTALEGNETCVLADVGVRIPALDRHRQCELYPLVSLPDTFHSHIALFEVTSDIKGLSVHGEPGILTPARKT